MTHEGANILLAYFHYCNKGIYPFSNECKEQDLRTLAELDDNMMAFVKETRANVIENSTWYPVLVRNGTIFSPAPPPPIPDKSIGSSNPRVWYEELQLTESVCSPPPTGTQWQKLHQDGSYEHDYYFVSQLFMENWEPRSTI